MTGRKPLFPGHWFFSRPVARVTFLTLEDTPTRVTHDALSVIFSRVIPRGFFTRRVTKDGDDDHVFGGGLKKKRKNKKHGDYPPFLHGRPQLRSLPRERLHGGLHLHERRCDLRAHGLQEPSELRVHHEVSRPRRLPSVSPPFVVPSRIFFSVFPPVVIIITLTLLHHRGRGEG